MFKRTVIAAALVGILIADLGTALAVPLTSSAKIGEIRQLPTEQVYYWRNRYYPYFWGGRYYPYRWRGRYYAHRGWYRGYWRYW